MEIEKIIKEIKTTFEVRKNGKQKEMFRAFIRESYPDAKIEEGRTGLFYNKNIVFGDPDTASVVIGAHYDTQANMVVPNRVHPERGFLFSLICPWEMILAIIIPTIVLECFNLKYVALAYLVLLLVLIYFGPANRHTQNDNTSGVIGVLSIMNDMPAGKDVCYVLFDNEEKFMQGSKLFRGMHDSTKYDLINMDLHW